MWYPNLFVSSKKVFHFNLLLRKTHGVFTYLQLSKTNRLPVKATIRKEIQKIKKRQQKREEENESLKQLVDLVITNKSNEVYHFCYHNTNHLVIIEGGSATKTIKTMKLLNSCSNIKQFDSTSTNVFSVFSKRLIPKKITINNTYLQTYNFTTGTMFEQKNKVLQNISKNLDSSVKNESVLHNENLEKLFNSDENLNPKLADKFLKMPKNILNNCFQVISKELNDRTLSIAPQYKIVNSLKKGNNLWSCTYNIKWPEKRSFSYTGKSKQEASNKAAYSALLWLYYNKKIDDDASPEKAEVKPTTKKVPSLQLEEHVENKLSEIKVIFENNLKKIIEESKEAGNSSTNLVEINKDWPAFDNNTALAYRNMEHFIIKDRKKLPISEYRAEILDKIENNRTVIIKGEPGCGKSTRIPQYVLEEWAGKKVASEPCRIIVTQPRRIAAVSLADRVANERNEQLGKVVGYRVRLDSKFNRNTGRIMYCTSGILLRRLQSDPKLSDCTHVILDEAHERDVYVDLLMNLLKRALLVNDKLKIIIMSATIDTKLFQDYFDNAPVLIIPGFTYPVRKYFIEEKSPYFAKTLKWCNSENPSVACDEVAELIKNIHKNKPEGAILCFLPGWDEISKIKRLLENNNTMSVLCLHSRMSIFDQRKVFSTPPPGIRKVILTTNIAETSVTVNDVVYVIDSGIHKEKFYDPHKGMYCLGNHWISQSSMTQRRGRAGRVQPGESYHLYTGDLYEKFEKFSIPEILRTSLTKIVLDSKVASNNMNAVDFFSHLPTPPDLIATKKAIVELKELDLLDAEENLTPLGRALSEFQLNPKLSKAMVNSLIYQCVTPITDIVTIFSADSELFSKGLTDKSDVKKTKENFSEYSDHLAFLRIFQQWLGYQQNGNFAKCSEFVNEFDLIENKLKNIAKLSKVHFEYLQKGLHQTIPISDKFSDNDSLVLGILLSGVGTILQRRNWDIINGKLRKTNSFVTTGMQQKATITSESVNFKKKELPSDYLLYLNETMSNVRRTVLIRESSIISPLIVLLFKNKSLIIKEVSQKKTDIDLNDEVILLVSETNIFFKCSRRQALLISECKNALQDVMNYYINQLTAGCEKNRIVDKNWEIILQHLNDIFMTEF